MYNLYELQNRIEKIYDKYVNYDFYSKPTNTIYFRHISLHPIREPDLVVNNDPLYSKIYIHLNDHPEIVKFVVNTSMYENLTYRISTHEEFICEIPICNDMDVYIDKIGRVINYLYKDVI